MPKTKTAKNAASPLVLLDSHAIIHRAYHALPDFSSSKGEPTGALYGLSLMLFALIEQFSPTHIAACFDLPKPTYRHEAYKGYKAGRVKTDEALIAQLIKAKELFSAFGVPIYEKEGFEADDMLGTIVEQVKRSVPVVIASGDMDTLQLVDEDYVTVFTLKKGVKDTVVYNDRSVRERYGFDPEYLPDYKGLRGDPSDNIIGVPGIGEKTATTLISKYKTIEALFTALKKDKEAFIRDSGVTPRIAGILEAHEEEALFSKMLGTIRRDAPITFDIDGARFRPEEHSEAIKALFTELEFRSLIPKAHSVFGRNAALPVPVQVAYDEELVQPQGNGEPQSPHEEMLLKEAGIMLWIIDSTFTTPTWDEIRTYTKKQTITEAHAALQEKIKSVPELESVFTRIERPLMEVVKHMETVGVGIDVRHLHKISKTYETELRLIEQKIWTHAGTEFNINSPKQLGDVLYTTLGLGKKIKKTATGANSTKESELEKIKDEHPVIPLVLEYRELQKLLSTYIDVIPGLVQNGRLHAQFLQAGTTTGRMSSQHPNLQNIPIKSERGRAIRDAFAAAPGYALVECDYSQIELRVAAFLSEDPLMIDIFKSGRDVHTEVAAQVFGVQSDAVTKDMRRKAKVINFGILYGMGINALRANLQTSRAEAQAFYTQYFETFTRLAAYLDEVKERAARLGYTETLFGRRRYFEGFASKLPYVRAQAERMAINAPIQGTESDIIKMAMSTLYRDLIAKHDDEVRLVLQVHDSLIFEVKKEKVRDIVPHIQYVMEHVATPEQTKGVPIIVDAAVGDHWGAMEKFTI